MFQELYKASEHWPNILYESFTDDCADANFNNQEMGDFITKNLLSRIDKFSFDLSAPTSYDAIEKVLEGERMQKYTEEDIVETTPFRTGDIIKVGTKFFINVKRQCDLIRGNTSLYLLRCNPQKICPSTIIKRADKLKILNQEIILDLTETADESINNKISEAFSKTRAVHEGKILETANEVMIPSMIKGKTYSISLKELQTMQISTLKQDGALRIGRLLSPYINILLHKFSLYFASEGTMRVPKGLYGKFAIEEDE